MLQNRCIEQKSQHQVFNINQSFSQLKSSKELRKRKSLKNFPACNSTEKKLEKKDSELLMPPLTNSSLLV